MKPRVLEVGNKLLVKPVFRSARAVVNLRQSSESHFASIADVSNFSLSSERSFPRNKTLLHYIWLRVMSYSRLQRHDNCVTVTVKMMMNKLRITRSEFSVLLSTSRN